MKEIYDKLNNYLNDICNYLDEEYPFLLEHIETIRKLNDAFLILLRNYSLDNGTIKNKLTYEDVYNLAREIIKSIDEDYLESFDNLIQSGELDFSYENAYYDSSCVSVYKNGELVKHFININREFNYNDVIMLVHEFIHYISKKKDTKNINSLEEFLAIYFELYALDYLIEKGINKEEIDYFARIKVLTNKSSGFSWYELVLLAYIKFGNIDDSTVDLLKQYFLKIEKKDFEKECRILYRNLCKALEEDKEVIEEYPESIGWVLSEAFIVSDYKYILGTFLAIYAHKYSNFSDVVNLNNHITEYDNESIADICLKIGIDLADEDLPKKLLDSIEEYINSKQIEHKIAV